MDVAIVTGSAGMIGAAAVRLFGGRGLTVCGIDNDMRRQYFGPQASTEWNRRKLEAEVPGYRHEAVDIRDWNEIERIFKQYSSDITLVIHSASQPSSEWAAQDPLTDLSVNSNGTLNVLEATRRFAPNAVFIHASTSKVYGDTANYLPFIELEHRWELPTMHKYFKFGVDESMPLDQSKHFPGGPSAIAADLLAQQYGRYYGMKTGIFRASCITGPNHSAVEQHGFPAHLVRTVLEGQTLKVFGYKGKQVRDLLHTDDLVAAFLQFYRNPRPGEVYNVGGGRFANCSLLEAIKTVERIAGKKLACSYLENSRIGDHIWWLSDYRRFQTHYPDWKPEYTVERIFTELYNEQVRRAREAKKAAEAT